MIESKTKRNRIVDQFFEQKKEHVFTYRFEVLSDDEAKITKIILAYIIDDPEIDTFFYDITPHYLLSTANNAGADYRGVFSFVIWSTEPLEEHRIMLVKLFLGVGLVHYTSALVKDFERDTNNDWRIAARLITKN